MAVTARRQLANDIAFRLQPSISGCGDDEAFDAAHALLADPAISVRRRRVLSGEWPAVAAALDELPVGTVIVWQAESDRWVALKDLSRMGDARWFEAGVQRPRSSESIARDGAPIEVLR